MNIIVCLICAAFALILGIAAGASVQSMLGEIRTLRSRVQQLEEQTRANQKTRNPYRTNEGLEDAMAIVHDAVWQADATLDYVRGRACAR